MSPKDSSNDGPMWWALSTDDVSELCAKAGVAALREAGYLPTPGADAERELIVRLGSRLRRSSFVPRTIEPERQWLVEVYVSGGGNTQKFYGATHHAALIAAAAASQPKET